MLPSDFSFSGLNTFASRVEDVAAIMSPTPQSNPAGVWFRGVDVMLRSEPDSKTILSEALKIERLMKSAWWPGVLDVLVSDAQEVTRLRGTRGHLRSLWGVTPIVSLKHAVSANRIAGLDSESLVFSVYRVTKSFDLDLSRHLEMLLQRDPGLQNAFYWTVLLWALLSYDIFFFYNDRGILLPTEFTGRFTMGINLEELALLRRASKCIYTLTYGADYRTRARAMSQGRFNFCMDCPTVGGFCFCNDEVWPTVFHPIAAYATAMLGTSLALREVPGIRRFDYIVLDTDALAPVYPRFESERNVRVLHVPNHAFFKGTRYLEAAMRQLIAEGARIEFRLVSGVSNDESLEAMRWCDILVDQLIGGYFGQTALEGMALGKPVIVYLADPNLPLSPQECPLINANPDSIVQVLKELTEAPAQLSEIGRRSRRYVENYYSLPALATRLRELYRETAGIILR